MNRRAQNGNVLFLILIAVALFAALSYAVTQSSRSGGEGGVTKDKAKLAAAEILAFFSNLDMAVQRVRVVNKIPAEQISMPIAADDATGTFTTVGANAACTVPACNIFHPDGGGIVFPGFKKYLVMAGGSQASGYVQKMPGVGSDLNDIVLRINYIRPEVCEALRLQLKQTAFATVSGTIYGYTATASWDASDARVVAGAPYGAYTAVGQVNGDGSCFAWHTVIAR